MGFRSWFGLLLGLVLQVSLNVPAWAWTHENVCDFRAAACGCCDDGGSQSRCPCVIDAGDEDPSPVPAAPAERSGKLDPAPTPAPAKLPLQTDHERPLDCHAAIPLARACGFPGVSLSVAFCRMLI